MNIYINWVTFKRYLCVKCCVEHGFTVPWCQFTLFKKYQRSVLKIQLSKFSTLYNI